MGEDDEPTVLAAMRYAIVLGLVLILAGCGVAEKEGRVRETTGTVPATHGEVTRIPGTPTVAVPGGHAYSPFFVHTLIHGCEKRGSPRHYCQCVARETEVHATQEQALAEARAAHGSEAGRPRWLKEAREACKR